MLQKRDEDQDAVPALGARESVLREGAAGPLGDAGFQEFLRDQGGYLMELLDLDELAADRVYEFMFVVAPLQIDRGLGSPITPVAIR